MEEFKKYLMEDLIEEIAMGPFGSNIKVDCFVDSGVPVLNGANLQGYKLREDSFNYVSTEKADSLNKANAYKGDIVITHRGTLGQIVYIPKDSKYERYVISQSQFRVRVNPQVALPEYVVFFFHTRIGQYRLLANASQVGVPAIARPTTTFKKVEIELPSLKEQERIVGLLNSLSDKIEINSRINHNLEELAKALYKSWFENEASKNWPETTLSAFFNVITGKKDANFSSTDGQYPFFTCSQAPLRAPSYSFDGNAILLAGNGDFNVKRYIGRFEAYQRTYVLMPFEEKYLSFLYLLISIHLGEITGGSRGSVIRFITKGNIADYSFKFPTYNIDEKLDLLNTIFAQIDEHNTETEHLSVVRNQLLLKIIC